MSIYSESIYKDFEKELDRCIKLKSNVLVLTVPGLGVSHLIKKYIERKRDNQISYINSSEQKLSQFNILDLNFDKDKKALEIADDYFKKATLAEKFALVVNTPYILETEEYKTSFAASHIYSTYFFKVRDFEDTRKFALEVREDLSEKDLEKIHTLSGGIGRIIKALAIKDELLNKEAEELLGEESFTKLLLSTIRVIEKTNDEVLEKIGIKENGKFKGEFLESYFRLHPPKALIKIKLYDDLTFEEDGVPSPLRLLKVEKLILEEMMQGNGLVSK